MPTLAKCPAQLAAMAFNQLDQYVGSPDHRTYCYTELTVSSVVVAETIISTHCAYPWRDGQAELTWEAGLNTKIQPASGHPSQY